MKTPVLTVESKGSEINLWLKNHSEVKAYLILDDGNNFYEDQIPHLVKTDPRNGLLYEHYGTARKILKKNLEKLISNFLRIVNKN